MLKTKTTKRVNQVDLNVDFEKAKKAYFALRAINHKTRQQILLLLHKNKEMTVSDIYYKLKLEQSQTSTYLAILRRANIVIARRDGQSVYYGINYQRLATIDKGLKVMFEG